MTQLKNSAVKNENKAHYGEIVPDHSRTPVKIMTKYMQLRKFNDKHHISFKLGNGKNNLNANFFMKLKLSGPKIKIHF